MISRKRFGSPILSGELSGNLNDIGRKVPAPKDTEIGKLPI